MVLTGEIQSEVEDWSQTSADKTGVEIPRPEENIIPESIGNHHKEDERERGGLQDRMALKTEDSERGCSSRPRRDVPFESQCRV